MLGPIKVKVFCGDITKETVEAIVNSTTTSLDLNTGEFVCDIALHLMNGSFRYMTQEGYSGR